MESLGIAIFMLFGGLMKIALFHPNSPASHWVKEPFAKNALVALLFVPVMLFGIVDSPWGKRTGAHINPAVTLAFWRLGKIGQGDALFYILFQFLGGLGIIAAMRLVLGGWFTHPAVDMNASKPGAEGPWVALGVEFAITFGLMALLLWGSNDPKLEKTLGKMVSGLIGLYLLFAVPFSGMSLNPARSLGTGVWTSDRPSILIYFVAPIFATLLCAELYRRIWPERMEGPHYPPEAKA
jgi:aquaporin Z